MKKRLFAMLLTLAMVFTFMPALAFADAEAEGQGEVPAAEMTEVTETQEDAVTEEPEEEIPAAADEEAQTEQQAPMKATRPEPLRGGIIDEDDEDEDIPEFTFIYEPNYEYTGYIGTSQLTEHIGYPGDKVIVEYPDDTEAVYVYDGVETYAYKEQESTAEDPEVLYFNDWDVDWMFASDSQSQFNEGTNYINVTLYHNEYTYSSYNTLEITGVERPAAVASIAYSRSSDNAPLEAYAGVRTVTNLNSDCPAPGDTLKVTYDDGQVIDFTYIDEGDFCDEEGKTLYEYFDSYPDLEFYEGQEVYEEGANTVKFYFIDYPAYNSRVDAELEIDDFLAECPITVTGVKSDVKSISYTLTNKYELEQEEYMEEQLEYDFPADGDVLTVNYTGGTTEEFTYYEDYGRYINTNGSDDEEDWEYSDWVYCYDDQEENPWTEGYYPLTINYQGVEYVIENAIHVTKTPHVHDMQYEDGYDPVPACSGYGETGLRPHYYCENCRRIFSDRAGTRELSEEDITIPMPAHEWEFLKVVKRATTTVKGQRQYECGYCGKLETRTDIPMAKAPTGVPKILNTVANSSKKTNDVIWDKSTVKNATNYELNWRTRGSSTWKKTTVGNTVRGVTTGLTIGGLYEIRVRPYRSTSTEIAYGSWSPSVYRYFHTTGKIRLASRSKGTFTMSWAKNSAATGYQVLYTTNKNGSGAAQNIKTAGASATSITVRDIKVNGKAQALRSGTTYYVQIREIKKVGNITYIGNISCPVAVRVK